MFLKGKTLLVGCVGTKIEVPAGTGSGVRSGARKNRVLCHKAWFHNKDITTGLSEQPSLKQPPSANYPPTGRVPVLVLRTLRAKVPQPGSNMLPGIHDDKAVQLTFQGASNASFQAGIYQSNELRAFRWALGCVDWSTQRQYATV